MHLEPAAADHALVEWERLANIDAELVLAQAGGDIRMRLGKDVGIDTEGEAGLLSELGGAKGEQFQLRRALHVELQDSRRQSKVDLRHCLADAGEDNPARGLWRSGQHPFQLAAGDDVKARPALGQQLENGQRRVDLDRVADEMIPARKRLLKEFQPRNDLIAGVDIERRAIAAGQSLQRYFAAVQSAALPRMVKGTG